MIRFNLRFISIGIRSPNLFNFSYSSFYNSQTVYVSELKGLAFGLPMSVRSKVEHPFLVAKRRFGFAKTRYRGLRKTANALTVLFAFANVAMWSRAGRPELPAESPA